MEQKSEMKEHHKTLVHFDNGESVDIDTSLVHLIITLNEYGIKTLNCCEVVRVKKGLMLLLILKILRSISGR